MQKDEIIDIADFCCPPLGVYYYPSHYGLEIKKGSTITIYGRLNAEDTDLVIEAFTDDENWVDITSAGIWDRSDDDGFSLEFNYLYPFNKIRAKLTVYKPETSCRLFCKRRYTTIEKEETMPNNTMKLFTFEDFKKAEHLARQIVKYTDSDTLFYIISEDQSECISSSLENQLLKGGFIVEVEPLDNPKPLNDNFIYVKKTSSKDPVFIYDRRLYESWCVPEKKETLNRDDQKDIYRAAQRTWLQAHGLAEGSKVKITATAESSENGWGYNWCKYMDKNIGKVGTICEISDNGISVQTSDDIWYYPYFVLAAVDEQEKSVTEKVMETVEDFIEQATKEIIQPKPLPRPDLLDLYTMEFDIGNTIDYSTELQRCTYGTGHKKAEITARGTSTYSLDLQFANGEQLSIPAPTGEGWELKEEVDLFNQYCMLEVNSTLGYWLTLIKDKFGYFQKQDFTFQDKTGQFTAKEYEKRLEEEEVRVMRFQRWEKEVPLSCYSATYKVTRVEDKPKADWKAEWPEGNHPRRVIFEGTKS